LLLANAISLAAVVTRARYAHSVAAHLRQRLLNQALQQPYIFHLQTNSSELFQRIQTDVVKFASGILLPLLSICSASLTISLMVLTITIAEPWAAIAAVIGVAGFYVSVFRFLRPRALQTGEDLRTAQREMTRHIQEVLANIKTIKVFEKTRYFEGLYHSESGRFARLSPLPAIYAQGPKYLMEPIGLGLMVALMITAALSDGMLSSALPTLGVVAMGAYRVLPEAQQAYSFASTMSSTLHVLSRVQRIGDTLSGAAYSVAPERPVSFKEMISFENVAFQYPNTDQPVLQGLNLSIYHHQSVGISGPSGSGKSTFVDLLLGLHSPTEGSILIDGQKLNEASHSSWRSLVAYVPQDVHLFDDSVAANIAIGVAEEDVDTDLLREAARAAQLLKFIDQELPQGFNTVIGERGARLSGGQRQRLGLARALYRRPEVLILDEATSALDIETETMVMDALRQLHGKLTMVVIAHRTDTLKMCDTRLEFPLGLVRAQQAT
jgi:ABC-type multidrug transport system fused ATPase/permease subunit